MKFYFNHLLWNRNSLILLAEICGPLATIFYQVTGYLPMIFTDSVTKNLELKMCLVLFHFMQFTHWLDTMFSENES